MRMHLVIRFDYGSIVPWVTRLKEGGIMAVAGPDTLLLRTNRTAARRELLHDGGIHGVEGAGSAVHALLAPLARTRPASRTIPVKFLARDRKCLARMVGRLSTVPALGASRCCAR